jgi:hypothetical protein
MSNGARPPIITKPGTIFDNNKPKIAEIFTHNTIVFERVDGKDIGIRGYNLDLENSKDWPIEMRDQTEKINEFDLSLPNQ